MTTPDSHRSGGQIRDYAESVAASATAVTSEIPEEHRDGMLGLIRTWRLRLAEQIEASLAELERSLTPIDAGEWWRDEDGVPHVVIHVGASVVALRRWDLLPNTPHDAHRLVAELRQSWYRLDHIPEPPVDSVYVIDGDAWQVMAEGCHIRTGVEGISTWSEVLAIYTDADHAGLRLLGSVSR